MKMSGCAQQTNTLSVAGADGIIFAFALWGSSQLLIAIIQLRVVVRYRSLIPFMWLMLILEVLLRKLVGAMKPVTFTHTTRRDWQPYLPTAGEVDAGPVIVECLPPNRRGLMKKHPLLRRFLG
jgi:hypothetical protein